MKKLLSLLCLICVLFISGCYDFSGFIPDDLVDYELLQSQVEENSLSANIKIQRKCMGQAGRPSSYNTSTGSGVIFKETENYYYFVTNNHVTAQLDSYYNVYYTIYDYEENEYYNIEIIDSSADYDLSIGKFAKGEEELSVVTFASGNPTKGAITISVGSPNGVMNVITFGSVNGYTTVTVSDSSAYLSNIQFDVLSHSAETTNGSSGGAVFNESLELIAIAFAGNTVNDVSTSYAVPIEMVTEFIDLYLVCNCDGCECGLNTEV